MYFLESRFYVEERPTVRLERPHAGIEEINAELGRRWEVLHVALNKIT